MFMLKKDEVIGIFGADSSVVAMLPKKKTGEDTRIIYASSPFPVPSISRNPLITAAISGSNKPSVFAICRTSSSVSFDGLPVNLASANNFQNFIKSDRAIRSPPTFTGKDR
jgi:hypothetical protein